MLDQKVSALTVAKPEPVKRSLSGTMVIGSNYDLFQKAFS
jgi:hypothetical protein